MNHQWRKKPVLIEAFQMTEGRANDLRDWPYWLKEAYLDKKPGEKGHMFRSQDGRMNIQTLEGLHVVDWGDYIIQGVAKEIYPCKPTIFHATYERPDQAQAQF